MEEKRLYITEEVGRMPLPHLIGFLIAIEKFGYNKLFFNGYESSIIAYYDEDLDYSQPERLNPEAPKGDAIV